MSYRSNAHYNVFDTVLHKILFQKLYHYNMRTSLLSNQKLSKFTKSVGSVNNCNSTSNLYLICVCPPGTNGRASYFSSLCEIFIPQYVKCTYTLCWWYLFSA